MATVVPASDQMREIRDDYLALTRRKRMYGGLLLLAFVVTFIAGFQIAEDRNAGSFSEGISRIFDFPYDLISEAWGNAANMPAHAASAFPALIEALMKSGTGPSCGRSSANVSPTVIRIGP